MRSSLKQAMFPAGSAADPDCYNYPHHHESSSSSVSSSTISADNASLYLYHHHHHHPHPQQPEEHLHHEQSLTNLEQWPHLSYYSASNMPASTRSEERSNLTEGLPRHQYMQLPGNLSREEQQLLLQQQPYAMQFQGISMMPAVEQYYNEQLMRSGVGGQYRGIDPRSMYESHHQLQMANQASSSSVLNRNVESLGRATSSEPAAARYEEACTPRPRWCPTQEQIQILESLFSTGTTTPSRDMIVDIAAQLRKYGTIAEANVFYWFQNRKARAKRKMQPPRAPYAPTPSPP